MELLKGECEKLKKQVAENHDKAEADQRPEWPVSRNTPLRDILLAKEASLKAEIRAVEERPISELPNDDKVLASIVEKQLESSISEMSEWLELIREQTSVSMNEIKRETELTEKLEQLNTQLIERVVALEASANEAPEGDDEARLIAEQQQQTVKLKEHMRMLLKKMDNFIQKHFPRITDENVSHTGAHPDNLLSLQAIIEELMNLCVESPHDPYVTLSDSYWPPYVELLLRAGIAIRHPDNGTMIKLTPYHL